MSQNAFEQEVSLQEKDYGRVTGDPIEVQNNHVLKSPTSGYIYQKCFGSLLQPPFLPTKMSGSVEKK